MATTPTLEQDAADAGTVAYDVVDGITVDRRVSIRSGLVAGELNIALAAAARATSAGRTFPSDVGYAIFEPPHRIKFPDVSFVRAERLSADELHKTFFEIAPDIAAEVVSPSDRAADVESKAQDWINAGTRLVWVLFPDTQSVHVHRLDGPAAILGPADTLRGDGILPGFEFPVSALMPLEIPLT